MRYLLFTFLLFPFCSAAQAPARQWDKFMEHAAHEVKPTRDGGFIFGGAVSIRIPGEKGENQEDILVLKTDSAGNVLWKKQYGGARTEYLACIEQTSDGGYIIGGSTQSVDGAISDRRKTQRKYADLWIVKLDANGNKQWDKCLGGDDEEELTAIHELADGSYILAAYTFSGRSGDVSSGKRGPAGTEEKDCWIVKLSASGVKTWDKRLGGNDTDDPSEVLQTPDGGYIVAATTYSDSSGDVSSRLPCGMKAEPDSRADLWLVKLDAAGKKQWDKRYGGSDDELMLSMILTEDGGFALGGMVFSRHRDTSACAHPTHGESDFWIVKTDAQGNLQWEHNLGGQGADVLADLVQVPGGYLLCGATVSGKGGNVSTAAYGSQDIWLIRLDASGEKQWDARYGCEGYENLSALALTSDGGLLLLGVTRSGPCHDVSGEVFRGTKVWLLRLATR